MSIYIGIDSGSMTTKIVAINKEADVVYSNITRTAGSVQGVADQMLSQCMRSSPSLSGEERYIVACGYGRNKVSYADLRVTEITAHAFGVRCMYPMAQWILDVGGEDTKAIQLTEDGVVNNFSMNNKCAAGTGRFLEAIAERIGCDLETFISLGMQTKEALLISHTCTVFTESEVVSYLAEGVSKETISRSIHLAISERLYIMLRSLGLKDEPFIMTGGVAHNSLIVECLRQLHAADVIVADAPQCTGARGAALIARKRCGEN